MLHLNSVCIIYKSTNFIGSSVLIWVCKCSFDSGIYVMLFMELWDGKVLRNIDHVWFIFVYIVIFFNILLLYSGFPIGNFYCLSYVLICRQLQSSRGTWWLTRLLCACWILLMRQVLSKMESKMPRPFVIIFLINVLFGICVMDTHM